MRRGAATIFVAPSGAGTYFEIDATRPWEARIPTWRGERVIKSRSGFARGRITALPFEVGKILEEELREKGFDVTLMW